VRHALERPDLLAQLLRRLVVGALAPAELRAVLPQEALERAQALDFAQQLLELLARLLVGESVVAERLDRVGERAVLAVPALQELVQGRRFDAVRRALRALLAVQ
jgi:hypothetical protein